MKGLLLFLSLVCALASNAQQANRMDDVKDAQIAATFDSYIRQGMQLWKTPGLSVAVVKNGKLIYKNGFGVTETGKSAPFTTSTLSICASTTKAMTAACIGMLVDEGKLKWTDKVSDVYPALKLYDSYASSEITVKDLLTHNTGLGNADWLWVLGTSLDSIIYRMRLIKPEYSFRSSFIYQNLMYMVAGEVIHHVSGKTWDEFIKERIFIPLGMTHTYPVYAQSTKEPSHITPHYIFDDTVVKAIKFIEMKGIDAAGGVWSCADDINKWMLFMLDSGKVNGKRLLKAETYAELFKPQAMVTPGEFYPTARLTKPHWMTYGLGWFQEDYRGSMVQFHTGSLDGAVAILGLIPDEKFGIYIFGNLDHTELRHALMYKAMDLWCFHDNKNDWSRDFYAMYKGIHSAAKNAERKEDSARVMNTHPSLALSAYAGEYQNDIYGKAEVKLVGESLTLQFPNDISLSLTHWTFDTFEAAFTNTWMGKGRLRFILDDSGKVSGFEMGGMQYMR